MGQHSRHLVGLVFQKVLSEHIFKEGEGISITSPLSTELGNGKFGQK